MSSALRTHYDPVQYFVAVADSSSFIYDDVSWSAKAGSTLTIGTVYRDLGQVAYWDAVKSAESPPTAPPACDVRKVALMTVRGVSTAAADQVWLSLGTRVKGSPADQDDVTPRIVPCSIAQIPGIASVRGGR